jgi:Flp pilus assembly pilin Flp
MDLVNIAGPRSMPLIRIFLADESGTTVIEYSVIGALISVAIIISATKIGSKIQALFYGPLGGALQ